MTTTPKRTGCRAPWHACWSWLFALRCWLLACCAAPGWRQWGGRQRAPGAYASHHTRAQAPGCPPLPQRHATIPVPVVCLRPSSSNHAPAAVAHWLHIDFLANELPQACPLRFQRLGYLGHGSALKGRGGEGARGRRRVELTLTTTTLHTRTLNYPRHVHDEIRIRTTAW
jgi:hypothetical protein